MSEITARLKALREAHEDAVYTDLCSGCVGPQDAPDCPGHDCIDPTSVAALERLAGEKP